MTIEIRVMPAEPTQEALDAIDALFSPGFCDGRMEKEIYRAVFNSLSAAPMAYRIVHKDGRKGGWVDGGPSAMDLRDIKDGVIQAVEQAYGPAEAGEQLRYERDCARGLANLTKANHDEAKEDWQKERDTLRTRLAEQDVLLSAIAGWSDEARAAVLESFQEELNESCSYEWYDNAIADLMKLVTAVSTSAAPEVKP